MTQQLTQKRTKRSGGARALVSHQPGHRLALAAILLLSAFLSLYGLSGDGYANAYYAAAVKTC